MKKLLLSLFIAAGITATAAEEETYPKFQYDLGMNSGVSNGTVFFEATGGLNWNLSSWATWRNAPFYRFQSGTESDRFGLDTSLRARSTVDFSDEFKPMLHAGAGFRFENTGQNSPFVEGGLNLHVGGFDALINVKWLPGTLIAGSRPSEVLFSVAFSGGTSGSM